MTSRSIIGEKVVNHENEDLGVIKELLIDPQSGKVEYGVMHYGGGLLGLGHKEIAVPYESLILDKEKDKYILNVDVEMLDTATETIEYEGKSYLIY